MPVARTACGLELCDDNLERRPLGLDSRLPTQLISRIEELLPHRWRHADR